MELVKPEPLIIGGRPHYTLTSYDPVSIEVDVASTSDADVELALQMTVTQMGGGPAELNNEAWIRENFEGLHNAAELRELVRQELTAMNAQAAEQQKTQKCAQALASRLMQSVLNTSVIQMQQAVAESFAYSMQEQGITEAQFLARSGMRKSDLQAMLAAQAKDAAEQEAAISAWLDHRKLQMSDDELPEYLGLPSMDDPRKMMQSLRSSGQLEAAREFALRNKALEIIVAEASCTYRHETPAEAQARTAKVRASLTAQLQAQRQKPNASRERPKLKLV